jgi:hypothetical protein
MSKRGSMWQFEGLFFSVHFINWWHRISLNKFIHFNMKPFWIMFGLIWIREVMAPRQHKKSWLQYTKVFNAEKA